MSIGIGFLLWFAWCALWLAFRANVRIDELENERRKNEPKK